MTNSEVIEVLEKEESYMLSHGGDRQAKALRIAIDKIEQEPMVEIDLYSVIKQSYIEREVLDKIRAEIGNINLNEVAAKYEDRFYGFQQEVIKILDKYKAESEG